MKCVRCVLLIVVAVCFSRTSTAADPKAAADLMRMQGWWVSEHISRDGVQVPDADPLRIWFRGHDLIYYHEDNKPSGAVALNSKVEPRQMDLTCKTAVFLAVYKIEGDKLIIIKGHADKPRPKRLDVSIESNVTKMVFRRQGSKKE